MIFDSPSQLVASNQQPDNTMDFSRRARGKELMDLPCTYKDLRMWLKDLAQVNSVTLAYRPTLRWIQQFAGHAEHRPLHIVDVGTGGGDALRRIERWAARERVNLRLTGIDSNPYAVQAAREFTPSSSRIRWKVGDIFAFDCESEPIDLIISSLLMHHMDDGEILRFLMWMERVSSLGWFVNDLSRSHASYIAFQALAKLAQWHHFICHDGPLSIRRAFLPEDWQNYANAAGLELDHIFIDRHWPGRLTVSRRKTQCALSYTQRTLEEVLGNELA